MVNECTLFFFVKKEKRASLVFSPSRFSLFFFGAVEFFSPKNSVTKSTLSLSLVKTNKKTHAHTKAQTKEESARAPLAGYTTTTRGSLANARGKESVVAANST